MRIPLVTIEPPLTLPASPARCGNEPETDPPMPHPRHLRPAVMIATAVIAVVGMLSSCGGPASVPEDEERPAGSGLPQAEAGSPLDLAEVCPATVVMQQDWQPESEHGAMYALVGPDYVIDGAAKKVTGSLVADGVDTGVEIEVRPGGANVGFQRVSDLMYLDHDILVGAVTTDQAINAAAAGRPVVAVVSQLTKSPQIYMWDPETYPGATTIAEVAASGTPIVTSGEIIPALLAEQGIVSREAVDASYEGTPQRFVTDPSIIQQGFGTMEPYVYREEVPQWGRDIAFQYLSEVGYSVYPEAVSVRAEDVEAEADCLARLVPILQRSQIDYLTDPALTESTNALIVELVDAYQASWTYSREVADFSAGAQLRDGLVTDDPASGVFGAFDPGRMTSIVDTFVPVLQEIGSVPSGFTLAPEDLYTNQFVDPSISMGK